MAQRCDECNTFMRRIYTPSGDKGWLCKRCAQEEETVTETSIIGGVDDTLDALGVDPRDEVAYFSFGLADTLRFTEAVSGVKPHVVSAACVYLGSILAEDKFTQPEVTDAADVSTTTMRNNYHDLFDASGFAETYGYIQNGELRSEDQTVNPNIHLDEWSESLEDRQVKESLKATVSNVRRFAYWYDGDDEPTSDDVREWLSVLASEGFSPATIEARYSSLKQYFRWRGLGELTVDGVNLREHQKTAWAEVEV